MYPNVHGTVGTICTLGVYTVTKDVTTSIVIGGILAFLSHDLMDRLGEHGYGGIKQTVLFEIPPLIIFTIIGLYSDLTWLYAVGWLGGNMIDLIDKKLGLSIINPSKYPMTFYFKCHRREPNINCTLNQTKLLNYICTGVIILFILIEKL